MSQLEKTKPNIFNIATKELSQDAFITWLLRWGDSSNEKYDKALRDCGVAFVTELIKTKIPEFNEIVASVSANRQRENIDVWAVVNHRYLIIIEDKTFTKQHSGQLKRYKEAAAEWEWEKDKKYEYVICIYLKTGNESQQSLKKVIRDGFAIYSRQNFIELLKRHNIKNDIFIDFKERLSKLEDRNHKWKSNLIEDWKGDEWQGFYQYLEEKMKIVRWDFVNNSSGGFWNAVLNWDYWGVYPVYLQTEQRKLCFKISTVDFKEDSTPNEVNRTKVRNIVSKTILEAAKDDNLPMIRKPKRFGNGKYMTLAVVDSEHWLGNKNEKVNQDKVVKQLKVYKDFLLETIKNRAGLFEGEGH
uniref:PD-(D/E)XK nuclease family protein n=1 Tax=Roseihalotalea indica TaxID=2867963 RepID=A0AA49GP84_9BACT|nr:PD-(D/E)XK nuclease family protein [Tunicatimonas sp. TK19036]